MIDIKVQLGIPSGIISCDVGTKVCPGIGNSSIGFIEYIYERVVFHALASKVKVALEKVHKDNGRLTQVTLPQYVEVALYTCLAFPLVLSTSKFSRKFSMKTAAPFINLCAKSGTHL